MFLGIKETTREYRLKKWAGIIAEQRKSGCQAFLKMSQKTSNISTGIPVLFHTSK